MNKQISFRFIVRSFDLDTDNNIVVLNCEINSMGYSRFYSGIAYASFSMRDIDKTSLALNLITKPKIQIKFDNILMGRLFFDDYEKGGTDGCSFGIGDGGLFLTGENRFRITEVSSFLCEFRGGIFDPYTSCIMKIINAEIYGSSVTHRQNIWAFDFRSFNKLYMDTSLNNWSINAFPLNIYYITIKDFLYSKLSLEINYDRLLFFKISGLTQDAPVIIQNKQVTCGMFAKYTESCVDEKFIFHRRSIDGKTLSLNGDDTSLDVFEWSNAEAEAEAEGEGEGEGDSTNLLAEITAETFVFPNGKWTNNKIGTVSYNTKVPYYIMSSEKETPIRFPNIVNMKGIEELKIEICHNTEYDKDKISSGINRWYLLVTSANAGASSIWGDEVQIPLEEETIASENVGKLIIYESKINLSTLASSQYVNIAIAKYATNEGDEIIDSNIYFAKIYKV
jgi:hypothetical protein